MKPRGYTPDMNSTSQGATRIQVIAAILGASGVALGALGAHALKEGLEVAGRLDSWQTAVLYHLVHAVAAFAATNGVETRFRASAWLWITGVVLFSGSIYILALGGPKWLGPITPIGGLALLSGWLLAAIRALRPSR